MAPMVQSKRWLAVAGVVSAILAVGWLAYQLPVWLAGAPKDAEPLRNQFIQLIGIVVTAAVATYGIKKHYLDKEKQYTDSFSAAIGHLGSDDPVIRAGGVRELERIMYYTDADRVRVLETYADYLRHHSGSTSSWDTTGPLPSDVSAVLAALRRRRVSTDEPPLELTQIRIPHADLRGATLSKARLTRSELTGANLRDAALAGADLAGATLIKADLTNTDLTGARLTGARLVGAILTRTRLTATDFTDAALTDTDLRDADLRATVGLTTEQLAHARTDASTQLPSHLRSAS